MGTIISFYSYKGGVGRSMALANIAFELSRKNKKVLIVDWDLEAPGLERYFSVFKMDNQSDGLLHLLMEFQKGSDANYKDYLWSIYHKSEYPLYLLSSGREKDSTNYSLNLGRFDWDDFFQHGNGGYYLEQLRNKWLEDFDFVLIDSRTGLSDASGVCTIMLPDIIVAMFTANYQSLFGIRDIMKFVQSARQKLSVDRMNLTILPVPSRFGTRVEFKEAQEWLDRISDILKDCFSDWLPRWIEPRYVLEKIKIPQMDYFSFGEKLAVVEQGTNDSEGVGFIYAQISNLLYNDFSNIRSFVGAEYFDAKKTEYENLNPINTSGIGNYTYDVFVSYPRKTYQWVRELFIPALTEYLNDELGYNPQIFIDFDSINAGDSWTNSIADALKRSKAFILITANDEMNSMIAEQDLALIHQLSSFDRNDSIFSITLAGSPSVNSFFQKFFSTLPVLNLSNFNNMQEVLTSTRLRTQFGMEIQKLATAIAYQIRQSLSIKNEKALNIDSRINVLCTEYETLRKEMPSGIERTVRLQNVFDRMKDEAREIETILSELLNSHSPGKRLAAIANLHVIPKINYLDWLADHVGDVEKPFVGYQAAVGLYISSKMLRNNNANAILSALDKGLANIQKFKYKDPNQVSVLNSAKMELERAKLK